MSHLIDRLLPHITDERLRRSFAALTVFTGVIAVCLVVLTVVMTLEYGRQVRRDAERRYDEQFQTPVISHPSGEVTTYNI